MKKELMYTAWAILVILLSIQFVPINRENKVIDENNDLLSVTQAPEEIQQILRNACYDCHSNETIWPWYSYVAPVSFFIEKHILEGRDNVNFSEWQSLENKDRIDALNHMKKEIDKNKMPLKSYFILHSKAKMTAEQKSLTLSWIGCVLNSYGKTIPN